MKSKVFFSSEITAEKVVELFHAASNDLPGGILPGKVAVKLHSGEPGNQNFLKPEFWQPVVNDVHGTVVECNTAYDGGRNTTEKHRETIEKHGWSKHFTVDIMDAEGPDAELLIPNGKRIKKVQVGNSTQTAKGEKSTASYMRDWNTIVSLPMSCTSAQNLSVEKSFSLPPHSAQR